MKGYDAVQPNTAPRGLDHLDGILNYCRTMAPLGVVEAVNGNIKTLLRRDQDPIRRPSKAA